MPRVERPVEGVWPDNRENMTPQNPVSKEGEKALQRQEKSSVGNRLEKEVKIQEEDSSGASDLFLKCLEELVNGERGAEIFQEQSESYIAAKLYEEASISAGVFYLDVFAENFLEMRMVDLREEEFLHFVSCLSEVTWNDYVCDDKTIVQGVQSAVGEAMKDLHQEMSVEDFCQLFFEKLSFEKRE